jgi:hypothetical protein
MKLFVALNGLQTFRVDAANVLFPFRGILAHLIPFLTASPGAVIDGEPSQFQCQFLRIEMYFGHPGNPSCVNLGTSHVPSRS